MAKIIVTDKDYNENNLLYAQNCLGELVQSVSGSFSIERSGNRSVLTVNCPSEYQEILSAEIADKTAEVVAINYKYEFFKKYVKVAGLNEKEYEILLASLIAADLEEDKRYAFEKMKGSFDIAIDGVYNFRLKALKQKWLDIVSFMPPCFINSQLKDFISYLLENKRRRIYIDGGKVFDCHYRRLLRSSLLDGERLKITREALLSNCGEIELSGDLPEDDEYYLKEFYNDKIYFHNGYFN